MIYDNTLDGNIKKVALLYISHDKLLCDCCNELKVTAHINTLTNDVMVICENCLSLIINEFK